MSSFTKTEVLFASGRKQVV